MKLLNRKKLILVAALPVVWLMGAGSAFGQAPANGTPEGRALELKDLLGSIEGVAKEAPRVFKAPEGYLRFVGAAPESESYSGKSYPFYWFKKGKERCMRWYSVNEEWTAKKEVKKMSGETNKKLKSMVCAGIVTLALAGCARANFVDSNSVFQDGIEYYIQTDKAVYDLGEIVEILYRVTNVTENRVDFGRHPLSFPCLFVITDNSDNEVWQWPWYIPLLPLVNVLLEPHKSKEHEITWDMMNDNGTGDENDDFPVGPGIYAVAGELMVGERVPVSVDIEIIPEPSTLALLGMGLVALLSRRKKRGSHH